MSTCNRCGAIVANIPCHRCGACYTEEVIEAVDGFWCTPGTRKSWLVANADKMGLTKQQARVRLYGERFAALLEQDEASGAPMADDKTVVPEWTRPPKPLMGVRRR